jgi:hypothetical protein
MFRSPLKVAGTIPCAARNFFIVAEVVKSFDVPFTP